MNSFNIDNFLYFYMVMGIITLGIAFVAHFGKTEGENKKTTTTIHKVGR